MEMFLQEQRTEVESPPDPKTLRERKMNRHRHRNSFDCPQSIIGALLLSIICNLSLFDSL